MRIEFEIDTEAAVVYTVGRGIVKFDGLVENLEQMFSYTDFNNNNYHQVD